ncbi:hypothetical protein [Nocardia sp. CC227C]|uniref:hypothetical protein n=1 Tax=Nocardia sp. CC227C TaxID=3044562 RepID=UPI00278BBF2F|nr:hypothetical protein [Nocardia sp. CC227C]
MFILRKSCVAIVLGTAAVLTALPGGPAAAEELPCPAHDRGETVIWDWTHLAICDDGRWTVRACAPGTTARQDDSGHAFCA